VGSKLSQNNKYMDDPPDLSMWQKYALPILLLAITLGVGIWWMVARSQPKPQTDDSQRQVKIAKWSTIVGGGLTLLCFVLVATGVLSLHRQTTQLVGSQSQWAM